MDKSYPRSYRIADQIQRELSELLRTEVKDPGIAPMLTVSAVDVSRDLSVAKVYIVVLDSESRRSSMAALGRAAGYLRSRLASRLPTRSVPRLHFCYDESIEHGEHLSRIIDAAVQSDAAVDGDE